MLKLVQISERVLVLVGGVGGLAHPAGIGAVCTNIASGLPCTARLMSVRRYVSGPYSLMKVCVLSIIQFTFVVGCSVNHCMYMWQQGSSGMVNLMEPTMTLSSLAMSHPVIELSMTQPSSNFFELSMTQPFLWKVASHFSGMSSTEIACQLDCTIRVASIDPRVVPWSSVGMQSMSSTRLDIEWIPELSVELAGE